MSGGNSRAIQQVPSRKRMQNRQSFSNERRTANRREARRLPAADSRQATPDRPREAHGAALAITKRTNNCQPLAIGQNAGYIAAARHRSKWRAAA